MSLHTLTDSTAKRFLSEHDLAIVSFGAPWCPACRAFEPVFERVAERHPDIAFGRVDSSCEKELRAAFGVSNVPFLAVVHDRSLVFSKAGAFSEEALEDVVLQVRQGARQADETSDDHTSSG